MSFYFEGETSCCCSGWCDCWRFFFFLKWTHRIWWLCFYFHHIQFLFLTGEPQVSLRWVSGATSRVQELQFGAGWAFALLQSDCRGRCVSELYLLLTWMKSPESWNLLCAAFHEFRCFLLKQHKQKHWSVINNLKGRIFNNWVFRVKHVSQTNIHIWASQIRNHSSSFRLLLPVSWSFGSWSLSDDWTLVLAVGRSGFLMFWFPSLVSEELSEAVAIVPAPQGLTLPWPPPVIFDPDPWHVHLDLHRRSCPETSSRWVPLCQSSSTAGGLHHVRLRGLHPCWEEPACMLWRNMGGGSVLSRLLTAVLTVCSLWCCCFPLQTLRLVLLGGRRLAARVQIQETLGSSEQLLRNASLLLLKRHTRRGRSRPSILQRLQGGPGVSGLLSGLDGKLHPYHHQPATGPAGEPVYTEGDQ